MRAICVIALLILMGSPTAYAAELPRLAVFDFEMLDTSLQGQVYGARADERPAVCPLLERARAEC